MVQERVCVVCGGPMNKITGDICCKEEDQYLLLACKGHLRDFEDRQCSMDDVVELLYDDLAEFLEKKNMSIEDYDYTGVLSELERRIFRWVNKEMINFRQIGGIGFCSICGCAVLAGWTKCTSCSDSSGMRDILQQSAGMSAPKQAPRRGMHFKR